MVSFILLLSSVSALRAEGEDEELGWAEDVLLRADLFKKAPRTGTRLWQTAPKLTLIGATKEQKKVVADIVKDLNETLESTPIKGIELLKPNDPRATIKVHFTRRARVATVAQLYRFDPLLVKEIAKKKWICASQFHPTPTNIWVVHSGVIILSSDKEHAGLLPNNALRSLCGLLGFLNNSKRYEKSVFYRDDDKVSNEVKLSERDRKLVRWYYNHVPPGTEELKKLFEKHWPKKN
jgi:hypothetical protein